VPYSLTMGSSWVGEYMTSEFNDGPGNVLAGHTSIRATPQPKQHVEPSFTEQTPVYPELNSSDENSYPLPPAWMTKSAPDEGPQTSPSEQPLRARNKPKVSIVALATAAVFLRRWMHRKRPPAVDETLDPSTECAVPISNVIVEEPGLIASSHSVTEHFGFVTSRKASDSEFANMLTDFLGSPISARKRCLQAHTPSLLTH
jgi:hypothetical protein